MPKKRARQSRQLHLATQSIESEAVAEGYWERVQQSFSTRKRSPVDPHTPTYLQATTHRRSSLRARSGPAAPQDLARHGSPSTAAAVQDLNFMFHSPTFLPPHDDEDDPHETVDERQLPEGNTSIHGREPACSDLDAVSETDQLLAGRSMLQRRRTTTTADTASGTNTNPTQMTMWQNSLWRPSKASSGGLTTTESLEPVPSEPLPEGNPMLRLPCADTDVDTHAVARDGSNRASSSSKSSTGHDRHAYSDNKGAVHLPLAHRRDAVRVSKESLPSIEHGSRSDNASVSIRFVNELNRNSSVGGSCAENSLEATHSDACSDPALHAGHATEMDSSGKVAPTQPRVIDAHVQRVLRAVMGTILLDYAQLREQESRRFSSNHTDTSSDGTISSSTGTTRRVLEACAEVLNALSSHSRRSQRAVEDIRQSLPAKWATGRGTGPIASSARAQHKLILQHATACVHQIGCDLMAMQRVIAQQCEACRQAWGIVHRLLARRNNASACCLVLQVPKRHWKLGNRAWNMVHERRSQKWDELELE